MWTVDDDPGIHRAVSKVIKSVDKIQTRLSSTLDDIVIVGIERFLAELPDKVMGPNGPIDTKSAKQIGALLEKMKK